MIKTSPILVFAYNRPSHLARTVEELKKSDLASRSDLVVFSDGPKAESARPLVQDVRRLVATFSGFRSITLVERETNLGLARSIIRGVSETLENYPTAIVIEDDLICAPPFLEFMNRCLDFYKEDPKIFSVTGFNFYHELLDVPESFNQDVFFVHRPSSCGWGTWTDRWKKVDWSMSDYSSFASNPKSLRRLRGIGSDLPRMLKLQMRKKIDSWAVRWAYHHFKYSGMAVYPRYSMIKNIGFDGTGTHSFGNPGRHYQADFSKVISNPKLIPSNGQTTPEFARAFARLYKRTPIYYARRALEVAYAHLKFKISSQ